MTSSKIIKNNFFILTGGPGSGKSSVLEQLKKRGYQTVDEVGRKIIKEQADIGGNLTHTGDRVGFRDLMLNYSLRDFKAHMNTTAPVFFDRGIPDLVGYSTLIDTPVGSTLLKAVEGNRYNQHVFIFPPWEDIYGHDEERKQDFQEAVDTYSCLKKAYMHYGYELIELPKTDINARVKFIINSIANFSRRERGRPF
jgi:predicted ATPase